MDVHDAQDRVGQGHEVPETVRRIGEPVELPDDDIHVVGTVGGTEHRDVHTTDDHAGIEQTERPASGVSDEDEAQLVGRGRLRIVGPGRDHLLSGQGSLAHPDHGHRAGPGGDLALNGVDARHRTDQHRLVHRDVLVQRSRRRRIVHQFHRSGVGDPVRPDAALRLHPLGIVEVSRDDPESRPPDDDSGVGRRGRD